MSPAPLFPPLLNGTCVPAGKKPAEQAIVMLRAGKIGAGDILWSEDKNQLNFSLVLEPEVPRERCGEMLYMLMVAFGDALGAISAPEVAINYRWPASVLLNEACVGTADLVLSDDDTNGVPNWILLSLDIAIRPDSELRDPGLQLETTTIWDEGCGDISCTQLLESVSRHAVNWIHNWNEDGFKQIHDQWMGRISEKEKIEKNLADGTFIGLDEQGNALIRSDGEIVELNLYNSLEARRSNSIGLA